jgi:hypothetical protein
MAASGASHLGNGKINLGALRDYYRRELLECLDKCIGTKVCILYYYLFQKCYVSNKY